MLAEVGVGCLLDGGCPNVEVWHLCKRGVLMRRQGCILMEMNALIQRSWWPYSGMDVPT